MDRFVQRRGVQQKLVSKSVYTRRGKGYYRFQDRSREIASSIVALLDPVLVPVRYISCMIDFKYKKGSLKTRRHCSNGPWGPLFLKNYGFVYSTLYRQISNTKAFQIEQHCPLEMANAIEHQLQAKNLLIGDVPHVSKREFTFSAPGLRAETAIFASLPISGEERLAIHTAFVAP